MAKTFVPKILANLELALDNDPSGELSLELMKNMGLSLEAAPPSEPAQADETFEQFRMTVTKRYRTNEHNSAVIDVIPTDPGAGAPAIMAPPPARSLSEGSPEPATDSRGSAEGRERECQAVNADALTP